MDKVLDSCFQLLSLFFMTIGRTSEAPAAYTLTSTIKRLLDHLTEAELFSAKDLESMSKTLDRLSVTVKNAGSKHSPHLIELLSERVDRCKTSLSNLRRKLDRLGDTLPTVHEKLISILRSMSLANTRSRVSVFVLMYVLLLMSVQFSVSEVEKLQNQLKEIDQQRVDGKFLTAAGEVAPGSDEVSELLRRCLIWSDIVLER